MKRLIVYDLDGTLVDTLEDIASSANYMLAQLGLAPIASCKVRRYIGRGAYQLVKDCIGTDDTARVEHGLKVYRAHYREHMLDHTRLYPHAEEVLNYFNTRTQAVLTNKPNPYSKEILHALRVAHHFAVIVAGDSAYPKKPDPAALRAIINTSGTKPADALLIGDSPIDVQTGRNAGVMTVGVEHGFAEDDELALAAPDVIVHDFKDLLEVAARYGW